MERLGISENRRFFVTEDNKPFFWLADTAWELFHRLSLAEAAHYLEDRRAKAFNVILAVVLAELDGLNTPNANGDRPLHNHDPTQINDAYFLHVDAILELAASLGLYIGLLPTWGDKVDQLGGIGPVIFDETSARSFGNILGTRYKDNPNIIWILGGDRYPNGFESVWRAMAEGIRAGMEGRALMSYHPRGPGQSSTYLHDEDWLDFNMIQSGHNRRDEPNWDLIIQDYFRTPVKPVLDGEPNYEYLPVGFDRTCQQGYFTELEVCKAAYRAVFAGACGHTYGHHSIWQMFDFGRAGALSPRVTWKEALNHPGAHCMTYLKRLIESRPIMSCVPNQRLLTSDPGPGAAHIRATLDLDGRYAMIYIPTSQRTVEIQMSMLQGPTISAGWYDPRNGRYSTIGDFATRNVQSFVTPDHGPDWILVLDNKACRLSPPGMIRE